MLTIDAIAEAAALERHIERLVRGARQRRQLALLDSDGIAALWLFKHKRQVAKRLSKALFDGSFAFSPATAKLAILDKPRRLIKLTLTDQVVCAALARAANDTLSGHWSPCLYSYRKGYSAQHAAMAWSRFVTRYRAITPVKQRGLYVWRGDVKSYTDCIPHGDGAPLWRVVDDVLKPCAVSRQLLVQVVRLDPEPPVPGVGLPGGNATGPMLCNLYLRSIDARLQDVVGGFYARYGDDMVFAHSDRQITDGVLADVDRLLGQLQLRLNDQKVERLYLTGNGAQPPTTDGQSVFQAAHQFEYVGYNLDFGGRISVKRAPVTGLLEQLKGRFRRALHLWPVQDVLQRGSLLAAVTRTFFESEHGAASILERTPSRDALRQFDFEIYRLIVRYAASSARAPAMRALPLKQLRQFGLPSLVVMRNG